MHASLYIVKAAVCIIIICTYTPVLILLLLLLLITKCIRKYTELCIGLCIMHEVYVTDLLSSFVSPSSASGRGTQCRSAEAINIQPSFTFNNFTDY